MPGRYANRQARLTTDHLTNSEILILSSEFPTTPPACGEMWAWGWSENQELRIQNSKSRTSMMASALCPGLQLLPDSSTVRPRRGWTQLGTTSAAGSRAKRRSCSRGWGSSRFGPRQTTVSANRRSRSSTLGPHLFFPRPVAARVRLDFKATIEQRSRSGRPVDHDAAVEIVGLRRTDRAGAPQTRRLRSILPTAARLAIQRENASRDSPRLLPTPRSTLTMTSIIVDTAGAVEIEGGGIGAGSELLVVKKFC